MPAMPDPSRESALSARRASTVMTFKSVGMASWRTAGASSEMSSNRVLKELVKPLPFGRALRPDGAMDKLFRLRQGEMDAAFCLVPLNHVIRQGIQFFFPCQHPLQRGFHFCPNAFHTDA